jgi:hypothetical protein
VQWKHVVMLAGEYLIADLNDQTVALIIEPLAGMVRVCSSFFQDGVRRDHLTRNEIFADAEVLKRALGLGAPEPVSWNFDLTQRVFLYSNFSVIQNVILS